MNEINIGFTPEAVLPALPVIGWGMLGIFIVIAVIIFVTAGLQKLFVKKK